MNELVSYRLNAREVVAGLPTGAEEFLILRNCRTVFGAHLTSYRIGILWPGGGGSLSTRVKRPELEVKLSSLSSAEFETTRVCIFIPHKILHVTRRDDFCLYL